MTKPALIDAIRALATEEKLDLLHDLWDEVAVDLQDKPLTDDERRFLEDRLRDVQTDPRPARPWQELLDDLRRDR